MIYDTKTALVLHQDLQPWQMANVAAFLSGGLVGQFPHLPGEPYRDAAGGIYAPLVREPVFVYGGDTATLLRTHGRATSRGLIFALYTREMFATTHDAANRAAVAACAPDALDLVGLGLHGERKLIDKVVNGLKFLA